MITKKLFFNANILNDVFDKNRVDHTASKALLSYAIANKIPIGF